jgi:hypothetical protein
MAFAIDGVRTAGPLPGRNPLSAPKEAAPKAAEPEGASPFGRVMQGLSRALVEGEGTMDKVRRAGQRDLGPGELLALQTEVYRYSEAVDLSAKMVDRVTSGIKTVLQGQ